MKTATLTPEEIERRALIAEKRRKLRDFHPTWDMPEEMKAEIRELLDFSTWPTR